MSINISADTMLKQLNATGSYSFTIHKERRSINEYKLSAKDHCDIFTKSLRNLKKIDTDSKANRTNMKKHIKNIVNSYNDLLDSSENINSKSFTRRMEKLDKLLDDYSDELQELGITKNSKGKLSFSKLKIDYMEDTKAFESVFGKDSDFSMKFDKYTKSIKSSVSDNLIQTINISNRTTVDIEKDKILMANSANSLSTYIKLFSNAENKDSSLTYIKEIMTSFNKIFDNNENDTNLPILESLSGLMKDNSEKLRDIGIEFDEDKNSLSFSPESDSFEDGETIFSSNYDKALSLFNGDFGSKLTSYSNDLFCQLLETSKHNINLKA